MEKTIFKKWLKNLKKVRQAKNAKKNNRAKKSKNFGGKCLKKCGTNEKFQKCREKISKWQKKILKFYLTSKKFRDNLGKIVRKIHSKLKLGKPFFLNKLKNSNKFKVKF